MIRRLPQNVVLASVLAAGGWMGILPAVAAQLRSVSILHGPQVHLSDLFSGLAAGQDCVLGDSPAPGARLEIGNAQLVAIAAQFGVDWVASSDLQSASLSRPGQPIDRNEVRSKVVASLARLGVDPDDVVTIASFPAGQIDLQSRLEIADASIDEAGTRFQAVLLVSRDGIETGRTPLSGTIERLTLVEVPVRDLPAGLPLEPSDLTGARVPAMRGRDAVATVDEAAGLASDRPLQAGVPIPRGRLHRPMLVGRNAAVMMHLTADGIDVTASGQAAEAGALGDRIRVYNVSSHMVLVGTITGPGEIRVEPHSSGRALGDVAGGRAVAALQPAFTVASDAAAQRSLSP